SCLSANRSHGSARGRQTIPTTQVAGCNQRLLQLVDAVHTDSDPAVLTDDVQESFLFRGWLSARSFAFHRQYPPCWRQHAENVTDTGHRREAQESALAVVFARDGTLV